MIELFDDFRDLLQARCPAPREVQPGQCKNAEPAFATPRSHSVARGRFVRCTTSFPRHSAPSLPHDGWLVRDKLARMATEVEALEARKLRAAARRARMTVEVVALGERKPPPYADSTPEERLAAAVRLIEHHEALRGESPKVPRGA